MKEYSVRELVFTALFIALVYVFTWLVKIQLPFAPNGGLIHLGNVPFFIACIFFPSGWACYLAHLAWASSI